MPVFALELKFDDKGSVVAVKRLNQIGSAASDTENEVRRLGESLKNAAQNVLALVGHCKTIGAMKDFVRRGAEFNSYMESGRIGIASLITSMVNLEDAQGRTLEGAEKYAAAQGLAADMMKEIQRLGLETTATAQELVEGVQSVMGPAVQAGLKLSEIPAFAVAAAQAMQTMGIPLNQMRTEIEALLTGNINRAQDLLAPRLGITKETLESWKAQGTLVENLMKTLEAFQLAGQDAAQTWKGLTGNLSDAMDVLAGQSAMSLSESLKQSVREIRDLVIDTREGSVGISGNFEHIAELLMEIEGEIGGGILSAVKSLVEGVKEFNQYLGDTGVTEVLDNVESAVMSASAAFLALKVSRSACNSEMLQGIKADISAQGVFGTLAQKIMEADAALQKKIATEEKSAASALKNAKALRESALAAEAEARAANEAAQREVMRQEIANRKARSLADSLAGTEQAARANALLAASEKRLAEAYVASHAAAAGLAQASSAVSSASTRVSIQAANFDRVAKSSHAAAVALSGLKIAGSSLLALFGGPLGLALTAGGAALGYLATRQSEAEKYADSHGEALRAVSEDLNEAADATDRYAEKLKGMTQAQLAYENLVAQQNLQKLVDDYSSLRGAVANFFVDFGSEIEEYQKVWDIATPLEDIKNVTTEQLLAMRDSLLQYAIATKNVDGYKNAVEKMINVLIAAKMRTEQTAKAAKAYNGENEKGASVAQQAATANNDLAAALDAVNKAGQKAPQGAEEAAEWLLKRTAQSETMKKALEDEAKGYDTLALAILNSAAAQAMMTGKVEEGRKLFEKIGQFSKGLQDLYAGRTGGKSGLSDAKKKAKELEQAMADLEAQTNRLTMTDEQFREWELTNRTLPKLREELKGAADAAQRLEKFEQATRSNWAKEDEEKAQEKARENLQIQADFYEQLREKSGRYGMGLEYVNKLIEQQAQAWKEAGIPEEYRKQLAEILRLEASTDGWDGARRAMRSYYADSMNMGRQFENFTSSTLSGLEDAFVDFAMTGKLGFSDLANSIISDLVRIAYQAMVVAPLLEALAGGKSGGGGLLGGLVGGLLGGGSSAGASMSVSGGLASGGWSPSSVFGWAKGGVFSGGNISDYSGSIVTQPTAFSFGRYLSMFAGGGGIMGEAGPEAILPLDRASNGRLGLAMSGMDDIMQQAQRGFAAESAKYMKFIAEQRQTMKPQITVNVINKTGQQVQAQTTAAPDGQGGMNMEIVLTQIEAGIVQRDAAGKSQLVNHLDRTRGLSRAGRLYR